MCSPKEKQERYDPFLFCKQLENFTAYPILQGTKLMTTDSCTLSSVYKPGYIIQIGKYIIQIK